MTNECEEKGCDKTDEKEALWMDESDGSFWCAEHSPHADKNREVGPAEKLWRVFMLSIVAFAVLSMVWGFAYTWFDYTPEWACWSPVNVEDLEPINGTPEPSDECAPSGLMVIMGAFGLPLAIIFGFIAIMSQVVFGGKR